ncbi:endonuclease NucS domain-containing protein [Actinomycetospora soli]|uniref:endonuclease NucS domain-containing protein n=1 Tax=Actinomycetospora soli TaxID=2893887 RepID=UPI001E4F4813|nr:endonuclease NucS domain-containing protein [Actinomycetospora soli]MCD2186613.1 EVE domain-containing protein [Actinomycetospora soli]
MHELESTPEGVTSRHVVALMLVMVMDAMGGTVAEREPQHWVWVTGPEYYLESDGVTENRELDPDSDYATDNWWTCHRDTKKDDLVVLYRSTVAKDIKYLIRATSDAYTLADDPDAEPGWTWGCDFEVIERFDHGIGIAELRSDPITAQWPALRAAFVRSAWSVPQDVWDRLLQMAEVTSHHVALQIRVSLQRALKEAEIEEELLTSPALLRNVGLSFDHLRSQVKCRASGFADLVGYNRSDMPSVVIELKRGRASRDAVAQVLGYRASLQKEYKPRRHVRAVLIAEALDVRAGDLVADHPYLEFIPLDDLDLRCRPASVRRRARS